MIKKMLAVLLVMSVVSSSYAMSDNGWNVGGLGFIIVGGLVAGIGGVNTLVAWGEYNDTKYYYENPDLSSVSGSEKNPTKKDLDDSKSHYDVIMGISIGGLVMTAIGIGMMIYGNHLDKTGSGPKRKTAYAPYPYDVDLASVLSVPQFAPPEQSAYRELDFGLPKAEGLRLSVQGSFSWAEDVR
jgi:hypothetical protein